MRFGGLTRLLAWSAALLWAISGSPTEARELHWEALEVEATLQSDGTLTISELQRMVFTGDWNGGERTFRLFRGQELEIDRIVRRDSDGATRELERGDLDAVDHWNWTSQNVVRWRSRRPEDPEFSGTRIEYRLDYRLTGALVDLGNRRFRLDHDFAFTDREGTIERVVVKLSLGAGWRATSPHPVSWESGPLTPGEGFVVPLEAEYTGDALPTRAARPPLFASVRWSAVGTFLAGIALFLFGFIRRDRALGRFGGSTGSNGSNGSTGSGVDSAWLEANVFAFRPEVIGAAWDREVGSSEVAALLARLTAEGKLASEVKSSGKLLWKRNDLHLRLLVPREGLEDYERALIDALFGDSDVTDTASLKQRYRRSGFDPAAKIRKGVEERVGRMRGFADGSPKPSWIPTGLLLLTGLALLVAAFALKPQQRALAALSLIGLIMPWVFLGMIPALRGQARVDGLKASAVGIFLSMSILTALVVFAGALGGSWMHVLGVLSFALGLARATFNLLKTRESVESMARRRDLVRARNYFEDELGKVQPKLEDRWFPYLLALGLAPKVDQWFKSFASAHRAIATGGYSGGTSSYGGSGGSGWSGGGGAFGGGGATATWAMAATAMSAGVASPSSSSSGGGGGSSGGGGGGGW